MGNRLKVLTKDGAPRLIMLLIMLPPVLYQWHIVGAGVAVMRLQLRERKSDLVDHTCVHQHHHWLWLIHSTAVVVTTAMLPDYTAVSEM